MDLKMRNKGLNLRISFLQKYMLFKIIANLWLTQKSLDLSLALQ